MISIFVLLVILLGLCLGVHKPFFERKSVTACDAVRFSEVVCARVVLGWWLVLASVCHLFWFKKAAGLPFFVGVWVSFVLLCVFPCDFV